jgi:hypothetical protein
LKETVIVSRRLVVALAVSITALMATAGPALAADANSKLPAGDGHDVTARAAAPAAYETYYLEKRQLLSNSPDASMPISCAGPARVWLLTGEYDIGRSLSSNDDETLWDDAQLVGGDYTVSTCLEPHNGYYRQRIWLDPDFPGATTREVATNLYPLGGTNEATWGMFLDPQF